MNKSKKILILLIFGIILVFSGINFNNVLNLENENLKISATSGKISISGNSEWLAFKNAGYCSGNGTYSDPYVIEDLLIDGGGTGNCIWIEKSDVYFKIENCTVTNSGGYPTAGIKLDRTTNGILINNNCSFNRYGIYLEDSNNYSITGNNVNNNSARGIYLVDCENNTISENSANCNWAGIHLDGSNNNNISGNTANENHAGGGSGMFLDRSNNNLISRNNLTRNTSNGIRIRWSNNNNISKNRIKNNGFTGIDISGDNNTIKENYVKGGGVLGIYLSGDNNIVSGNVMQECGLWIGTEADDMFSNFIDTTNMVNQKSLYYYTNEVSLGPYNFTNAGQVILINCNNSILSNLNTSFTAIGLALYYCNYNYIWGNTANNNSRGINLHYCNENLISENNVSGNRKGIHLYGSIDNNISENIGSNNEKGIEISSNSNNSRIMDNHLSNSKKFYGIYLNGWNNILSGNTLNRCGLIFSGSLGMLISNDINISNLVEGKPVYYYVNEVNLQPNNFSNAGQVVLVNCTNSVISSVSISYCSYGMTLYYSDNNTLLANTAENNNIGIYLYRCEFNNISGNYLCDNEFGGILLYYSFNNQISENSLNFNDDAGIYMSQSDFNFVSNNIIDNNSELGIVLDYSDNNEIIENEASDNYEGGISVHNSDNNTVIGNIINNNGYGIEIYHGEYNTLSGNSVNNNNLEGIFVSHSVDNILSENIVNNNTFEGIYLYVSIRNSLSGNNISSNAYGIHLESSYNNSVYYNNFVNNDYSSIVEPLDDENTWNSEVELTYNYKGKTYTNFLGNYWDNYIGNDADNDGIGDTPFVQGFVTDYYPLMEPIGNYEFTEMIEPSEIPFDLIILISIITGTALIGVATLLLIIRKKRRLN